MSDKADSALAIRNGDSHDDACSHHMDPRRGLCFAPTLAKKKCPFCATIISEGHLSVCKKHGSQRKRAGRCQAVEGCGQQCDRFAEYAEPYHLCEKHQKGTGSLPCHIMRLVVELRLMIFGYLFPKVIPAKRPSGVSSAVLMVNRQVNLEASSVLYGEAQFEAEIDAQWMYIQGKTWLRFRSKAGTPHLYGIFMD